MIASYAISSHYRMEHSSEIKPLSRSRLRLWPSPVVQGRPASGAVVTARWGFPVAGILERDVLQCNLSDRSFDLLEWQ